MRPRTKPGTIAWGCLRNAFSGVLRGTMPWIDLVRATPRCRSERHTTPSRPLGRSDWETVASAGMGTGKFGGTVFRAERMAGDRASKTTLGETLTGGRDCNSFVWWAILAHRSLEKPLQPLQRLRRSRPRAALAPEECRRRQAQKATKGGLAEPEAPPLPPDPVPDRPLGRVHVVAQKGEDSGDQANGRPRRAAFPRPECPGADLEPGGELITREPAIHPGLPDVLAEAARVLRVTGW